MCGGEECWSIFILTYTGTVKGFDRVLNSGKPLAGRASMKQRWRTLLVLGFDYLPEGRKAPKQTVPRGLPVEKVRSEVGLKLKEMDDIIARAVDRLGHGQLLDHPILGPLTGAQWRKFHYIHGRHHIKQIVSGYATSPRPKRHRAKKAATPGN